MFPSLLTIVKDAEEDEDDQEKINLQVTLTTQLGVKMVKESKLIKKHHDQWRQDNGYHYKLGAMIAKVKKETKWRDIFKIVEKAQKKLKGEK